MGSRELVGTNSPIADGLALSVVLCEAHPPGPRGRVCLTRVRSIIANERQLSEMLGEFARTMVKDIPVQDILDRLVERIVDILPITGAGATLMPAGSEPCRFAGSDAHAMRLERLQSELGQGPSLDAYHTGTAISAPNLFRDRRFPEFSPRALNVGLVAMFAFPFYDGRDHLGALDLYRDVSGWLDPSSVRTAAMLADVVAAYLTNAQGRADLQATSDRSRHASLHDGLTGLPNRMLMLERLDHAIRRARRSGLISAVLFMDLDGFKAVNDTYGHAMGDDLLAAVARRLSGALRSGDTLARLSGDEFVILCEDLPSATASRVILDRVDAALAEPFVLSSVELNITASIGIACASPGRHTADEVLRAADAAMYGAKRAARARRRGLDHLVEDPEAAAAL